LETEKNLERPQTIRKRKNAKREKKTRDQELRQAALHTDFQKRPYEGRTRSYVPQSGERQTLT